MKTPKITLLTIAILSLAFLSSCQREGCTDPDSKTYNPDAGKDDGSCLYEGQNVIWYGQATANGLVNDDAITLTYYVDGEIVGSTAASIYWNGAPNCGQNASITITKQLGGVKSKAYTYSVKDQTGHTYWSGVLNFTANTCEKIELKW